MSRFRPIMIAIVLTIPTFVFASLTFAKQPPKSPLPPRPKPGHGSSLANEQIANPQQIGNVTELGNSSGITITHGGNPPRTGGGITITHGGNPPRSPEPNDYCHESSHRHDCDRDVHACYEETFEPLQSACMVLPGDTFETVSLREYRTNSKARSIASFNKLSLNAALVPGQMLMLP